MDFLIEQGSKWSEITLNVERTDTIKHIKHLIHTATQIPISQLSLFHHKKPLIDDKKKLGDYKLAYINHLHPIHVRLSTSKQLIIQNNDNYHSILPLALADKNFDIKHIYECNIDSTLMKIVNEIEVIPSEYLTQCKISLLTQNEEISLNYKQLYVDQLWKMHCTIQSNEAFKIQIKYKHKAKSLVLILIFFPIRAEIPSNNIKSEVIKFAANIIEHGEDKSLLDYAQTFIHLSLPSTPASDIRQKVITSFINAVAKKNASQEIFDSMIRFMQNDPNLAKLCLNGHIWSSLDHLFNPCTHKDTLIRFSSKYSKMCRYFSHSFNSKDDQHLLLMKQLLFFVFHEDNTIIKNGINGLKHILSLTKMLENEFEEEISILYQQKIYRDSVLFNGYLKTSHKFIPNDIAYIIYSYYNCYTTKQYDFVERLFYLLDKSNGYNSNIRDCALSHLAKISTKCNRSTAKILIEKYDMINRARNLLNIVPVHVNIFIIVANLVVTSSVARESDLVESMISVFGECVGDTYRRKECIIAANAVKPVESAIRVVRNGQQNMNILDKYCFIKHVLNLCQYIIMHNLYIKSKLKYKTGDIIQRYLQLIRFIIRRHRSNMEIQKICKEQIKEYGVVLLNNLKDQDVKCNLNNYQSSIAELATNLLNAIDN